MRPHHKTNQRNAERRGIVGLDHLDRHPRPLERQAAEARPLEHAGKRNVDAAHRGPAAAADPAVLEHAAGLFWGDKRWPAARDRN